MSGRKKKRGNTPSIQETFNAFLGGLHQDFPRTRDHLVLVDSGECLVYGLENPTPHNLRVVNEAIARQHLDKYASAHYDNDVELGLINFNSETAANGVGASLSRLAPHEIIMERYMILDHEFGHLAMADGLHPYHFKAEVCADAYALLRHYQRFGTQSSFPNKRSLLSPFWRARNTLFNEDPDHVTYLVTDALIRQKGRIDIENLSPAETIALAQKFAVAYAVPYNVHQDIRKTFAPVREIWDRNRDKAIKTLIETTLASKDNYYSFKFGFVWLNNRYFKKWLFADGTPINLPTEYLRNAEKELKKIAGNYAKQEALFDMFPAPSSSRKRPQP